MKHENEFIFCSDHRLKQKLNSLLKFGILKNTSDIYDNHYLFKHGLQNTLLTTKKQPVVFIDNDLDYYCISMLTEGISALLINKNANTVDAMKALVLFNSQEYDVCTKLTKQEISILYNIMKSFSIPGNEHYTKSGNSGERQNCVNSLIQKLKLRDSHDLYRAHLWWLNTSH